MNKYKKTLKDFNELMAKRMEENNEKTWSKAEREELQHAMWAKVFHLQSLFFKEDGGDPKEISKDCADVANFAMLISAISGDTFNEQPSERCECTSDMFGEG